MFGFRERVQSGCAINTGLCTSVNIGKSLKITVECTAETQIRKAEFLVAGRRQRHERLHSDLLLPSKREPSAALGFLPRKRLQFPTAERLCELFHDDPTMANNRQMFLVDPDKHQRPAKEMIYGAATVT